MRAAASILMFLLSCAGPAAAQNFSVCIAGLKQAAIKAGINRALVARALDIAQPDEKVLRLSEVQPEFDIPIWDYFAYLVDEQRVAEGRAMMQRYDAVLRAAEQRFGVDRHVIAAVWGVDPDLTPPRPPAFADDTRDLCYVKEIGRAHV